jgi:hypothetical protein
MMWTRREIGLGITCLVVGSVGQLVQLLVTPVSEGEQSAASNVAKAVAHPTAMATAAWLDLTILFFLPALVVVAYLAGARTTRLGWFASVLAIGTAIPGIAYVLAPDVLYVEAIHGHVSARAIDAYNGSGVVSVATIVFLVGHVLGLILLAVALWRARAVPVWAAACLGASPILEIVGSAGLKPVGALAYLLLMVAFGACAITLVRSSASTAGTPESAAIARS